MRLTRMTIWPTALPVWLLHWLRARTDMIAQWIGSADLSPAKARRCGNIPTSTTDVRGGDKICILEISSMGDCKEKNICDPPFADSIRNCWTEFGRVGITFCPGKYDPHSITGAWDRDLATDLDAIRAWGAAAIVTLLEPKELTLLRVEHFGEEVLRRNMLWFHLPIVDVSVPSEQFEEKWDTAGEDLRSILRRGSDVLVHCRGGLGRAGTIVARLSGERPGGASYSRKASAGDGKGISLYLYMIPKRLGLTIV